MRCPAKMRKRPLQVSRTQLLAILGAISSVPGFLSVSASAILMSSMTISASELHHGSEFKDSQCHKGQVTTKSVDLKSWVNLLVSLCVRLVAILYGAKIS